MADEGATRTGAESSTDSGILKSIEDGVFVFAYRLSGLANRQTLNGVWQLAYVVETLQLLALLFPDDPHLLVWSHRNTAWLRGLCRAIDKGAYLSTFGSTATATSASLLIVLAVLVSCATVGTQPHYFRSNLAYTLLRAALILLSGILYVPTLNLLFIGAASTGAMSALYGIGAIILIVTSVFSVTTLAPLDLASPSIITRSTPRVELAYLAMKTVLVALFSLTTIPVKFLAIILTPAAPALVGYMYLTTLPDHAHRLLIQRNALLWSLTWLGIVYAVAVIIDNPQSVGPFYMFLAGTPLVIAGAWVLIIIRIQQLVETKPSELNSPFEVDLKLRLMAERCEMEIRDARLARFTDDTVDIDDKLADESITTLLHDKYFAEFRSVINIGVSKFPESSFLQVRAAIIYFTFLKLNFVGYDHLGRADALPSTFDIEYMIYRTQRDSERNILEAKANREVVEFNRYEDCYEDALGAEQDLMRTLISFWGEARQPIPDKDLLVSLSNDIIEAEQITNNFYNDMFRIYSKSVRTIKSFGHFMTDLGHDEGNGARLLERATAIEDVSSRGQTDQSFRTALFSDASVVIVISGDTRNLGEIISVNDVAVRVFGIPRTAFEGKNVLLIIPEPIASQHNMIIRRNLMSGSSRLLDKRRTIVVSTRSGFLLDAIVFLKAFVSEMKMLSFLAVISVFNEADAQVVVDSRDGIVTAVSHTALDFLNITKDAVDAHEVRIRDIFPDYDNQRVAFLKLETAEDVEGAGLDLTLTIRSKPVHVQVRFDDYPIKDGECAEVLRIRKKGGEVSNQVEEHDLTGGDAQNDDGTATSESTEERSVDSHARETTTGTMKTVKVPQREVVSLHGEDDAKTAVDGAGKANTIVSGASSNNSTSMSALIVELSRKGKTVDKKIHRFKQIYIAAMVVIVAMLIGISVLYLQNVTTFMSNMSMISASANRAIALIEITFAANALMLINSGVRMAYPEANYRQRLTLNGAVLLKSDQQTYSNILSSSLASSARDLTVGLQERQGNQETVVYMSEHDACSYIAGQTAVAAGIPLTSFTPDSTTMYLLTQMIRGDNSVLVAVNTTSQRIMDMSKSALTNATNYWIYMSIPSVVAIGFLFWAIVRPLLSSIEADRLKVISFFLAIPSSTVIKIEKRLQTRLDVSTSTQADLDGEDDSSQSCDNAADVDAAENGTESGRSNMAGEKNRDGAASDGEKTSTEVKGSNKKKHTRNLSVTTGSGNWGNFFLQMRLYILVIIVVAYVAAVMIFVTYSPQNVEQLGNAPSSIFFDMLRITQARLLQHSVFMYGRAVGGTPVPNQFGYSQSDVLNEIRVLHNHQRAFMFGDGSGVTELGIMRRSYSDHDADIIQFKNGCYMWDAASNDGITAEECRRAHYSVMATGIYKALNKYTYTARFLTYTYSNMINASLTNSTAGSLPLGVYTPLPSHHYVESLTAVESYKMIGNALTSFMMPQLRQIATINYASNVTLITNITGAQTLLLTVFSICVLMSYVFFFLPVMLTLDEKMRRTRALLRLIPNALLYKMRAVKDYIKEERERLA